MTRPIMTKMRHRENRGFTLIELLVTLVILGILTTVAIPAYTSFVAGQRIKTASFDMMSMMIFTRSEAMKRNANVTLNFDLALNAFTVTSGTTVLLNHEAFTGLDINCKTSIGSGGTNTACPAYGIIYTGNGRLLAGFPFLPLEITSQANTSSAYARCITIDLSGRPNSKKGVC